jgi:ABC-type Fe3+/spermidine/putrescine transport system ATPase subunit
VNGPPPGSGPLPLLRLEGVTRRFGSTTAVREASLAVEAGEYLSILGPSGSGKSTLLRLVAGFERPDAGSVHLDGARVDDLPPERRDLNTVFQGYALFPHLTVEENVAFGLRMKKRPRGEIAARVGEAPELVGLSGFGPRRPGSLSGGEQQRVALARALVNRPRLLLLDEPLAALDRKLRLRMQEELTRIQRETGITFLHVTHDQEEALRLADRVAVMNRGRILQLAPPAEAYLRPRTPFVADFLGSATLVPDGTARALFPAGLPPSPAGIYAVRPEAIGIEADGAAPGGPGPPLRGRVLSRHTVGGIEELRVEAGGVHWLVHVHAGRAAHLPAEGDGAFLALAPGALVPLEADEDAES